MHNPTNVLTLPARRRDDTLASEQVGDTHRSTPAFAVPPPLPFEHYEPFADSLLAQARAKRLHAANVALAQHAEERMRAEQLHKNQLNEAYRDGQAMGVGQGFTQGWYWGAGFGVMLGGALMYLCIKAGTWAAQL